MKKLSPRDEGSEGGRRQGVPGRVDGCRRPPEGHRVVASATTPTPSRSSARARWSWSASSPRSRRRPRRGRSRKARSTSRWQSTRRSCWRAASSARARLFTKSTPTCRRGWSARYKQMETDALRKDVGSGKVKIDDLRKRGMTDDQIRELISGRKLDPRRESFEGVRHRRQAQDRRHRPARSGGVEARHRGPEAPAGEREVLQGPVHRGQRRGQDRVREGRGGDERGDRAAHARSRTTRARIRSRSPSRRGSRSSTRCRRSSRRSRTTSRWRTRRPSRITSRTRTRSTRRRWSSRRKRYQERLKNDVDIAEKNLEHLRTVYAFEEQRAGFERDARLRQVGGRGRRRRSSRRSRSSSRKQPSRSTIWRRSTR